MINIKDILSFEHGYPLISNGHIKAIDYNDNNFYSAIATFLRYKISDKYQKIISLHIGFDTEIPCRGTFFIEGEKSIILLNLISIGKNKRYEEKIRSLLSVTLHEIGHYLDFLSLYNSSTNISLEELFEHYSKECNEVKRLLEVDPFQFRENYYNIESEFNAAVFSAANLSTFENMYENPIL